MKTMIEHKIHHNHADDRKMREAFRVFGSFHTPSSNLLHSRLLSKKKNKKTIAKQIFHYYTHEICGEYGTKRPYNSSYMYELPEVRQREEIKFILCPRRYLGYMFGVRCSAELR